MNYYIEIKGRAFGPFSREQIDEKIAAGWLTRESRVSYDGQNWQKAGEVGELFPNAQQSNFAAPTSSGVNAGVNVNQTSQPREWYFSVDGKTGSGPFTADDIIAAFNSGKATLESLVWREGEYARPIKNEPFFANLAPSANVQTNVSFAPGRDVYDSSARSSSDSTGDPQFTRTLKNRQFKAWFVGLLTFILGVLTLIAVVCLGLKDKFDTFMKFEFADFIVLTDLVRTFPSLFKEEPGLRVCVCSLGAFEILSLLFIIFQPTYLCSLWKSIPAGDARIKSVEGAGFLFIPFFNVYWIFVALYGCVCDVNKALRRTGSNLENRLFFVSEGVAMTYCIIMAPCLTYWFASLFWPVIYVSSVFPAPPIIVWMVQLVLFLIALGFDVFYLSPKLKKAALELNLRSKATN